jgi:hypothetical protein
LATPGGVGSCRQARPCLERPVCAAATQATGGLVEAFETLKRMIQEAEDDVQKAAGGNKAAGTRARKMMQDIKNAAQKVREEILKARPDKEKTPGGAGGQPS